MWQWLRRRIASREEPGFHSAPVRARTKTYSAANGHVYSYVYRGWRSHDSLQYVDHVFEIAVHGNGSRQLSVRIDQKTVGAAETLLARTLLGAERYAIAKLTLFSLLDQATNLESACAEAAIVTSRMMCDHLATLGRI